MQRKKLCFYVPRFERLVVSRAGPDAPLYDIRSVPICLLAFCDFLRFEQLARLLRSDVVVEGEMLQLFMESSKTDQHRGQ